MIFSKFIYLKKTEKKIIAEAFSYFLLSIILVRFFKLNFYARYIGKYMTPTEIDINQDLEEEIKLITRNILRVKNMIPFKTTCLEDSIVTKKILDKRNIKTVLYLGLKKEKNNLIAHAWTIPNLASNNCKFKAIACFK